MPPTAHADKEQLALLRLRHQLVHTYGPRVPAREIDALVDAATARYATAPIRDFVVLLVERDVRDALRHRVTKST